MCRLTSEKFRCERSYFDDLRGRRLQFPTARGSVFSKVSRRLTRWDSRTPRPMMMLFLC